MKDPIAVGLGAALIGALLMPWHLYRMRQQINAMEPYKVAFEWGPTPTWIKNEHGVIMAVNKAFTDAFGLTMDDYHGKTLEQQMAYWESSGPLAFEDSDRVARETDEVVYVVHRLVIPRPDRAMGRNKDEPQEFFISKRRFPIKKGFHTAYGTIGSAKSIEQVLEFAETARLRHEEMKAQNPIIQAINNLAHTVNEGFSITNEKITNLSEEVKTLKSKVENHNEDLEALFSKEENAGLQRTRIADNSSEFDKFVS